MRYKIIGLLFAVLILVGGATVLYYNYRFVVNQSTEMLLNGVADDIVIKASQHPAQFSSDPDAFLPPNPELSGPNLFIQLSDRRRNVVAKSSNLKLTILPVDRSNQDIFSDLTLQNGSRIKSCQKPIFSGRHLMGYVVVASSVTQMHHNFSTLRRILIVGVGCTIIIFGLGINALFGFAMVRNQKQFLSFASHELRTPLAVVSGHAEVALRGTKTVAEYQETLRLIQSEANRMSGLVNDFLYLFRNTAKKETLNLTEFNLGELVTEMASETKARFPQKKITLILPDDSKIEADRDRIRQVIVNLLANAARHTGTTGEIILNLVRNNHQCILEVKDNGGGIDPALVKKIFTPFFRVNEHDRAGTGLGLAICKWIVDQHRGHIAVTSSIGNGSCFRVSLPVKQPRKRPFIFF